ncbi:hypothetical protein PMAYCL1PPCAC_22026, partial [Pristionchus mayeri]
AGLLTHSSFVNAPGPHTIMDSVYDAVEAVYIFIPIVAIIVLVATIYLNSQGKEQQELDEAAKQELETLLRKED